MRSILLFLTLFFSLSLQARDVKILTWNVFMLPQPLKFSKQSERLQHITEALRKTNYDVIVLQEAFWEHFRNRIGENLKSLYPHQHELGRSSSFQHVMPSGVFVLSKTPFKVLGHDYYQDCASADCFSAKGVLLLEFDGFQLAGTHMQSGSDEDSAQIRKGQLSQIAKILQRFKRPKLPQILVGDLNINALKDVQEFNHALKVLSMTTKPLSGEPHYTSALNVSCYTEDRTVKKWIDHMLIDGNGSSTRLDSQRAFLLEAKFGDKNCDISDHHPVEGIIHL